jgi:penicillin-binding protein 1A
LAQSLNTASVRLMQQSGGPRGVAVVARRLGIADELPGDLSLAPGTGEVGLLELASAYAVLFNGGLAVAPHGIEADRRPVPHPGAERLVDAGLAADMVRMMGAVVPRGSGRAAAVPGRFVAGKTGTTQDYKDAWFIGEVGSGGTVIGVWLGNDDGRAMRGVTGSSLPARLFREIAAEAHQRAASANSTKSSRRSRGAHQAVSATIPTVTSPPAHTAADAPSRLAATPLSNAPISLGPVIK